IDLDIVVEYGVPIAQLAQSIRRNVTGAVEQMTGLDVVENNINVNHLQPSASRSSPTPPQTTCTCPTMGTTRPTPPPHACNDNRLRRRRSGDGRGDCCSGAGVLRLRPIAPPPVPQQH